MLMLSFSFSSNCFSGFLLFNIYHNDVEGSEDYFNENELCDN